MLQALRQRRLHQEQSCSGSWSLYQVSQCILIQQGKSHGPSPLWWMQQNLVAVDGPSCACAGCQIHRSLGHRTDIQTASLQCAVAHELCAYLDPCVVNHCMSLDNNPLIPMKGLY